MGPVTLHREFHCEGSGKNTGHQEATGIAGAICVPQTTRKTQPRAKVSMASHHLHPEYFQVRFRGYPPTVLWPQSFAIVSGLATTGQQWTEEANRLGDQNLHAAIEQRAVWHVRIVGYSPTTSHFEPSWACDLTLSDAIALGVWAKQDAIYWVEQRQLWVSRCRAPELHWVDTFENRLTGSSPSPT
jgi:hypothetical protein